MDKIWIARLAVSSNPRRQRRIALVLGLGFLLTLTSRACAALATGVYQTVAGATGEELGDRVPNRSRTVPLFATVTFDFSAVEPSLTAVITNAVLEGGDPFPLIVRSASGAKQVDGAYRFQGDYLRDIYPSGTQYLFDWRFSTSTNGEVVWNGTIDWAGGHLWYVTISNLTLVPVPWLNLARGPAGSIRITWATVTSWSPPPACRLLAGAPSPTP